MTDEQQGISQKVEQNVRMLIGDLYMQLIVMKAQMEYQQQQPIPTQATNGHDHEKRTTL
jgi:hypothetical protein